MKRRLLVRIQILCLVVLALIVIARVIIGPPAPDGLVVFVDLDPHTLRHQTFELDERTEVAIRATGSLDPDASSLALAAQSWIVRRADREVVWQMDPRAIEQGRGHAAHVRGDTLVLEAGLYDAYFASFGQAERSGNRRQRWRSDADQWQFVLQVVDETTPARVLPGQRLDRLETPDENLVWSTAPMRNNQEQEYLFEVKQATDLDLYAVGEIDDEPVDFAWIEDAGTGRRVWGLARDNTEPAGGLASNRRFQGSLRLKPGAYRAVAKTDRRHAYGSWEGNPPYEPAAWGLSLSATDAYAIADFDPWSSREPIVSFTRVPDGARLSQRFEVTQPMQVVVYAVGEMTDRNGIYDFAELVKEEATRKRSIWKMSWDGSIQAGGDKKNRLEVVFLRLEPGAYALTYESDGSHSFEDWNATPPDYPERWGATLFPVATTLGDEAVRLLQTSAVNAGAAAGQEGGTAIAHVGDAIVAWTQVRGEVDERKAFTLEEEAQLHIVALGEITYSSQYDYGWIERAETGDIVWEMVLDNTEPAGGPDRNRRFDGVVTLPPGQYVAHYVTDASHHYGFFGNESPDTPEAWGITIHYVARDGQGSQDAAQAQASEESEDG